MDQPMDKDFYVYFLCLIKFLTRGRPYLPPISSKKNLDDYVTERSALLLERFCPSYEAWLTKNPPWDGISEYEEAKVAIRAIVPVNNPGNVLKYGFIFLPFMLSLYRTGQVQSIYPTQDSGLRSAADRETYFASILAAQMRKREALKKD